ncbi:MAG TPA: response regulator [Bryobacteraceae bacterium]|nr:response regulator [Bryobacteraceae bacterium]
MAYRILVVDDSPAMRSFVRRVLQMSGLEVSALLEASNGKEALEILRDDWVDFVLTDINMPGMDGEEFLRNLSSDEMLRRVPVAVISTDATANRVSRLLALGARGYITKPFRPEYLRAELERMLGVACG